eukprot:TRINITY_DN1336_c0_g1_i4.p1 TRINITY_DN1336_c0_g1~~TRINITY_DN1336_c0_g1_i4.p1  ORF type:complete len:442 (-),score=104.50 TRINITY_DN1336_c0_g1_i4:228-1553(-)
MVEKRAQQTSLLPQTLQDALLPKSLANESKPLSSRIEEFLVGKKGGIRGSFFSLGVSMIGVGLLTLPRIFSENGIILGTLLVAVIGIFMGITVHMLIVAEDHTKEHSMERIATSLLGVTGGVIVDMILCVLLIAIMCAKLDIISSALKNMLTLVLGDGIHTSGLGSHEVSLGLAFALVFPLALMTTVTKLRFSSTLGVYALLTVVVVVMIHGTERLINDGFNNVIHEAPMFNWSSKTIAAIPLIIFSYGCHPQATEVYAELTKPSLGRMGKIITISKILAGILYCLMGIFGVFSFPTLTEISGDILGQFDSGDVTTTIARVAMSLEVICSFPMLMLPARSSLYHFLQVIRGKHNDSTKPTLPLHVALTLFIGCLTYLLALKSSGLEEVLGYAGAICGSLILIIYPTTVYAMSIKKHSFGTVLLTLLVGAVGLFVLVSEFIL